MTARTSGQQADREKRIIHLQGTVNFRDIGGYKTKDDREVKWAKVYRSAAINRLSHQDLAVLSQRGISTIVDFRTIQEAREAPDQLLPEMEYVSCPIGGNRLEDTQKMVHLIMEGTFLQEFYSDIQYLGEGYKPMFHKLLALPEDEALVYHCTGGRDRTGIATALFLYLLDVPEETIEADYTLSNIYLQPMYGYLLQNITEEMGIEADALAKALELKPELIRAMFSSIEAKYGLIASFFQQGIGLRKEDIALLKEKYTR